MDDHLKTILPRSEDSILKTDLSYDLKNYIFHSTTDYLYPLADI